MSFFRRQEVRFARRLLAYRYEQMGRAAPPEAEMRAQAEKVVEEAHRIARERGRNVAAIIGELLEDLKRKR